MAANAMTISRLAAAAGVHVETVRYYQRRGLLQEPERPQGSIRRYGTDDVGRLHFIRRAQAVGFRLDEIAGLLEVKGRRACEQTLQLTERKLAEVRQRLETMYMESAPTTPEEFGRYMDDELKRWKPLIERLNISDK